MHIDYLLGIMSSVLGTGDMKVNGIDTVSLHTKKEVTDLDKRGMIGKYRILRDFSLEKGFRFNTSPEFSDWLDEEEKEESLAAEETQMKHPWDGNELGTSAQLKKDPAGWSNRVDMVPPPAWLHQLC